MDDDFAEKAYDTLWGLLEDDHRAEGVEDLFEPGKPCAQHYDRMLDARERLCARLGVPHEDADVECIIDSLLGICRLVGLQMYDCGKSSAAL